jgi:hypothetical protein
MWTLLTLYAYSLSMNDLAYELPYLMFYMKWGPRAAITLLVVGLARVCFLFKRSLDEMIYVQTHTYTVTETNAVRQYDAYVGLDGMGAKVLNYRDPAGNIVEVRVSKHVLHSMVQDTVTEMPIARSVPVASEEPDDSVHFRYQINEDNRAPIMSEAMGLGFRRGACVVTGVHVWRDLVGKGRPVFVCHKNRSVQIIETVPVVTRISVELDFVEFRLSPAIWSTLGVKLATIAKVVKPGEVITITGFMNGAVVKTYGRVKRYEGRPLILGHTASTIPSFSGGAIKNAKGDVVGVHLRHGPIGSDINLGIDYACLNRFIKPSSEESYDDGSEGSMTRVNSSQDEVSNAEQLARVFHIDEEIVIRGARGSAYVDLERHEIPYTGGRWGDYEEMLAEAESSIGYAFTSRFAGIADAYGDEPLESGVSQRTPLELALIDALIHRTPEDIERAVSLARTRPRAEFAAVADLIIEATGEVSKEKRKKRRKAAIKKKKELLRTTSTVVTDPQGVVTTVPIVPAAIPIVKVTAAPVVQKEKKVEKEKQKTENLPNTEESAKEKVTSSSAQMKSQNQQSTQTPVQNSSSRLAIIDGLMEKVLEKKCDSSSLERVNFVRKAPLGIPRMRTKRVILSPSLKNGSGPKEDPKQN